MSCMMLLTDHISGFLCRSDGIPLRASISIFATGFVAGFFLVSFDILSHKNSHVFIRKTTFSLSGPLLTAG